MAFVKNFLNFRSVTKDISGCFDMAWELMVVGNKHLSICYNNYVKLQIVHMWTY